MHIIKLEECEFIEKLDYQITIYSHYARSCDKNKTLWRMVLFT